MPMPTLLAMEPRATAEAAQKGRSSLDLIAANQDQPTTNREKASNPKKDGRARGRTATRRREKRRRDGRRRKEDPDPEPAHTRERGIGSTLWKRRDGLVIASLELTLPTPESS